MHALINAEQFTEMITRFDRTEPLTKYTYIFFEVWRCLRRPRTGGIRTNR